VSDQNDLEPFLDKDYRDAWLDMRVKAGIAYQIQAIRQSMGMSQAEFGALLAKPQSVVSRLEDNEYAGTIKTLLEIAKSLGVGLKVEFCSYPELLATDVSPAKLAVETIDASVARAREHLGVCEARAAPQPLRKRSRAV
jgi:transcriptional regulator with XRE-family HTH domain